METIPEEIISRPSLLLRIIKAIRCKMSCCSGSSCQLGEFDEKPHPAVETRDFEEY